MILKRKNLIKVVVGATLFLSFVDLNSHQVVHGAAISTNKTTSERDKIILEAKKHIGKPYTQVNPHRLGPNSFDCSGLIYYVFKQVTGKNVGNVTWTQENAGAKIAVNQAKPGDLLFWGAKGNTYHSAIYLGNNQYIHSPTYGKTVEISPIWSNFQPSFAVRMDLKETAITPAVPNLPLISNGSSVTIKNSASLFYDGSKITATDKQNAYIVTDATNIATKNGSKRVYSIKNSKKKLFEADVVKQTSPYSELGTGSSVVVKNSAVSFYSGGNISQTDKNSAFTIEAIKDIPKKYNSIRVYKIKGQNKWFYEADISKQTSTYSAISVGSSIILKSSAKSYYNGSSISKVDKNSAFILEAIKDIPKKYGSIRAYKVKGQNKWFYEADVSKQTSTYAYHPINKSVKITKQATHFYDGKVIPTKMKSTSYKIKAVKDIKKKSKSIRIYQLQGISSWLLEQDIQ